MLVASTAAIIALAFMASTASATRVKPANTKITATLTPGTNWRLLPNNAYNTVYLSCSKSEFTFTTSIEGEKPLNTNRTSVGTFSRGPGSVRMEVGGVGPTLGECLILLGNPEKPLEEGVGIGVMVFTHEFAGANPPGIDADEFLVEKNVVNLIALTMPSVLAKGGNFPCEGTETIFPVSGKPGVLVGEYTNKTKQLKLDGQVLASGCFGSTTAQVEASYTFNEGFEIIG
jgi:hypothetical protein